MKTIEISLNLNEIVRTTIRKELRQFGQKYPDCKFNIICWVDDLVTDSAQEIDNYLAENECETRLTTGGRIMGKSRTTFYRHTKNTLP